MKRSGGLHEDDDVARALEWLYETCGDRSQDVKTRVQKAQDTYIRHVGNPNERGGDITLDTLGADLVASYLAQADALINNAAAYDLGLGTHVVPFIKQLGENLDKVKSIAGASDRAARMLLSNGSDPSGGFFELVTALRYVQDGYQVEFVPERRGISKTADFQITRAGATQHVECKRLRSGPYEAKEKSEQRRIFDRLAEFVERDRLSLHIDVTYTKELHEIPDGYLASWAEKAITSRLALTGGYPWKDEIGFGTVKPANIRAVQKDIRDFYHLLFGSKLARLLIGHEVQEPYSMAGVFIPSHHDPRYISEAHAGTVVTWRCVAETSMTNKSRHIKSHLSEIEKQLLEVGEGVGHIGMDADGDIDISDLRRAKNYQAVAEFQSRVKINALYLHYFVCRITETKSWMIDETVDYFSVTGHLPLTGSGRIFTGGEELLGELPAWHQKPPPLPGPRKR
ncbi:hypothetical protein [Hydrocarboniphaga effusa]|uniref:Uncharacterized protein n=1 Tax=Hydrocarboniphaga effusa AP103 TaxID=1172194 RepID=I8TDI2_9GAMM|nr:hypothetical protein [Hydrocarboniphaga effusa]EIT72020.1 hypothetical protein WQQ_21570 [Hydrocarboniphaga effusa AP103]